MQIEAPKKIVADISNLADKQKREAFLLKTKSATQGAFWGGALGLMFAFYKGKNKYISTLVGIGTGALVSNILTIKK